ncbi:glycosyltransferase family 4 protein [Clostridium baratii]|uniref:glycosyltransferase family 4 protein n=1 Tax=Clostridium baratii TaxID=1561 RepID=UPI0006BA8DB9|nr:glycosyltransferase [Clostridium baratii]
MKVAFYLDNSKIKDVDMSNPYMGNPGIGGTQYMIWVISFYLKKYYPQLDIIVFANYINKLPKELTLIKVKDIKDSVIKASKLDIDLFIFRSIECKEFYDMLRTYKLNSVAWAHNFSTSKELKYINECKYVKRYICVGKQQYNMLKDHSIIEKADYIYNCINTEIYKNKQLKDKQNILCYVGSINPAKGFHKVCKVWKRIKNKIPNSELWVIGSGKLYDKECLMGKYGIAESKYEKKFIKYIVDKEGKLPKDIVFWGVQSEEKKLDIMSKAKVGIVNPTAKTETFCISAIEFEMLGVPVVTRKKNGFLDTVKNNQTGILAMSESGIVKSIVKLLNDSKLNNYMSESGMKFVEQNFDIEYIVEKWYKLISNINNNKYIINDTEEYSDSNIKKTILLNKKIKKINLFKRLPALYEYKYYIKDIISILLKRK